MKKVYMNAYTAINIASTNYMLKKQDKWKVLEITIMNIKFHQLRYPENFYTKRYT